MEEKRRARPIKDRQKGRSKKKKKRREEKKRLKVGGEKRRVALGDSVVSYHSWENCKTRI